MEFYINIVRLMSFICALDTYFVMFCNQPPCLQPVELSFQLPTESRTVDIMSDSSIGGSEILQDLRQPPSLNDLTRRISSNKWKFDPTLMSNLGVFDMYTLACGTLPSNVRGVKLTGQHSTPSCSTTTPIIPTWQICSQPSKQL